jgi:spermidine synthase
VLLLGLGAGSIIEIIRKEYHSAASITAVEIDPVIIEIAQKEFKIHQYPAVQIIESDALAYVNSATDTFDVICTDLFIQDEVPLSFLSPAFIEKLVKMLRPGGKIYFNFMDCSAERTHVFNQRTEELQARPDLSSVIQLKLEENNRILVVTR